MTTKTAYILKEGYSDSWSGPAEVKYVTLSKDDAEVWVKLNDNYMRYRMYTEVPMYGK